MRDADVRAALRERLSAEHAGDHDTKIVEEMGIWSGSVRIDVAVINGELTGYELKSDRDTLDRLKPQAELYSRVFDRVCLVVGSRHVGKARRIVPRWWSVIVATMRGGTVHLDLVRDGTRNPNPDPLLLARLLWREEVLAALEEIDRAKGWRSKSASALHERLAAELDFEDLSSVVRGALKRRDGWLGKPVSDVRQVAIDSKFDPVLPTACARTACSCGDLAYALVGPAPGQPAKPCRSDKCIGVSPVLDWHWNTVGT